VSHLLRTHLSRSLHTYTFIDFCAGGGGPTPSIERHLNQTLRQGKKDSKDDPAPEPEPVHFVLTDLHPHTELWAQAAAKSPFLSYVPEPVDAAKAPRDLLRRFAAGGEGTGAGSQGQGRKKVFRLFNLAFHHFDDGLARRILRDTVEGGGDGFG
jgi:hypothetical protein